MQFLRISALENAVFSAGFAIFAPFRKVSASD